jgi:Fic family protein
LIQARANTEKARSILNLYEQMKQKVVESTHSQYALQSLDGIFTAPIFSSSEFKRFTGIPKASSARILSTLRDEGIISILEEASGRKPAVYIFRELIDIVNQ